jgi:hypothetical protein
VSACNVLLPRFKASPNVTVVLAPLTVIDPSVFPAVVSVPVAFIKKVPVYVIVIPALKVILPETKRIALPAKVPVNPVQLMDLAPMLPAEIVQVPLDVASKNTSSADVGTAAPVAPPAVAAHFAPAVPSHAAVPPRQNLSAMTTPSHI